MIKHKSYDCGKKSLEKYNETLEKLMVLLKIMKYLLIKKNFLNVLVRVV